MKKSYLMIAAVAALLAACSSNDTFKEVNEDVAIGFESKYTAKPTKAEIDDTWLAQNGANFGVFGYKYAENADNTIQLFNNEEVTYDGVTDNDWEHTTVRYWDKAAADAYYFYAYAPFSQSASFDRTAAANETTTGFKYNLGTQVFAFTDDDNTIDLCVARVEQTDYNKCYYGTNNSQTSDGHVSFTFNHVLSKLVFSVKCEGFQTTPTAHTVTLRSIKVALPTATGVNWTQNLKTADAGKVKYTNWANKVISNLNPVATADLSKFDTQVFIDNDNNDANDVIVTTTAASLYDTSLNYTRAKSFIVTPNEIAANANDQTKHKIYLQIKYDVNYNDDDTNPSIDSQTAYGAVEIQFEQNYVYNLIVNIKPAEIRFDVDAVEGFTPANPALDAVDVE